MTSFDQDRTGNVWSGNVWDDGDGGGARRCDDYADSSSTTALSRSS